MTEPIDSEGLEELIEKHGEDVPVYTVHAVTSPRPSDDKPKHDGSWSILKDSGREQEEVFHRENNGRPGGRNAKEIVKEKARELAEDNRPAVVAIEKRNGEIYRAEVAR